MTDDPHTLRDDSDAAAETVEPDRHGFWADEVADRIVERRERLGRGPDDPVVIKGGVSPSGVPHLGHANEIMRGYFVAEALRERGYEVRQVFTSDDRDPLRKVPRTLADRDWNVMDLGEAPDPGALGRNLGTPLTDVPDPFGCCESFGDHQTTLLESMAESLGVPVEIRSTTALYESGDFDGVTHELLEKRDRAHDVLAEYQASVREADEYVPFNPVCADCGKITETVTAIDLDAGTVEYTCTDLEAGNQVIEGCGHEGTATLRDGKLPWRFEWPAQWNVLNVDFEPFGKDHAEGSWPSGEAIARELLDFEPPTPMVYEWFTFNGEPLSSSSGHVVTVSEMLGLLEPEVLRYFFTKDPTTARDLDIARLNQLVDEFDQFEGKAFGESVIGGIDEDERDRIKGIYRLIIDDVPDEWPTRLPYTFAAVVGMTDDPELREKMARRENHIPADAPEATVADALARVDLARTWAERVDNEYNYRLAADLPAVEFDAATEAALDDLADFVEAGHDGEAIQSEIFETARRHDLDPGNLFAAGYRLFFDTEQGPQLGTFLADLDRAFVVRRLRREA